MKVEKKAADFQADCQYDRESVVTQLRHEINTPLTVIMGYSELLLNKENSNKISAEQQQQFILEIFKSAQELYSKSDSLLRRLPDEYSN